MIFPDNKNETGNNIEFGVGGERQRDRDRETKAGSLEIPKCKRRLLVHGVAACVINSGVEDVSARSLCLTGQRDEGIMCLDSWNHYFELGNTVGAKQDLSRGHLDLKR